MIHGTFSVADKDVRKHKQMFMPSAENQCIIGGSVLSTFFFFFKYPVKNCFFLYHPHHSKEDNYPSIKVVKFVVQIFQPTMDLTHEEVPRKKLL